MFHLIPKAARFHFKGQNILVSMIEFQRVSEFDFTLVNDEKQWLLLHTYARTLGIKQ